LIDIKKIPDIKIALIIEDGRAIRKNTQKKDPEERLT